jgi:dipeptidyl aminopeptidase/acylaminoacyl peptidase
VRPEADVADGPSASGRDEADRQTHRYGSWPSPITASSIVEGAATITEVAVDGDDVWWAEARPNEGGRVAVLRRRADGMVGEVTPAGANARTRVHEYGGGAWWVRDGVLVYAEMTDQQLRRVDDDGTVTELTADAASRYADGRITRDGRWYVCVREQHHDDREPTDELVAVAMDGSSAVATIVTGADFYAAPRPSPDGTRLAWVQWNHPDMPWDGTELWVATLGDGTVSAPRRLAGGRDESLLQPEWSPAGELHVISDRSDWWNLYRVSTDDGTLVPVRTGDFEIGGPMWVFGESAYAFRADGSVVVDQDVHAVASYPTAIRTRGDRVVLAGASWQRESQVLEMAPDGSVDVLRAARDLGLDPAFLPEPEAVTFPTGDGTELAHALFYAPANPDARGPEGERPPLVVLVHGGPTGSYPRSLRLPVRYWTSRGFAVVEVDYRGSAGYGRPYRRALDGRWGIADVEDAIAAAHYLADRGDIDGQRMFIRGGSAGGYTVLCALTFHDAFTAGASHFGVADLEALVRDTHKFESRYLDRLIGPYPERLDLYEARSPIHHTERLRAPMIVLQGSDDRVVPRNQAEMMVAALRDNGVPHAYVLFDGEGHGFRRAENIVRALEAELSFYAQLFGFTPADPIEPVHIHNLR